MKFSFFKKFFKMCFKERKGERCNSLAMNPPGSSATRPFAPLEKHFLLKCSPCICSSISRRMNCSKQRLALMKLSL